MTSLEMAGVQVSVLKMSGSHKTKWLECLDAKTDACAWPGSPLSIPVETCLKETPPPDEPEQEYKVSITPGVLKVNQQSEGRKC